MANRLLFFLQVLLTLVLGPVPACKLPPPGSPGAVAIHCTSAAVQNNWHTILPAVNSCLSGGPDYEPCLIGLINPAAGIAEDVLACVLQDQAPKFAASARANPGDPVSARAATRAKAFMAKRGYVFAD